MYARKSKIVFYWIYLFEVKTQKIHIIFFNLKHFKHVRLTHANKFKRNRTKALRATLAPRRRGCNLVLCFTYHGQILGHVDISRFH